MSFADEHSMNVAEIIDELGSPVVLSYTLEGAYLPETGTRTAQVEVTMSLAGDLSIEPGQRGGTTGGPATEYCVCRVSRAAYDAEAAQWAGGAELPGRTPEQPDVFLKDWDLTPPPDLDPSRPFRVFDVQLIDLGAVLEIHASRDRQPAPQTGGD